MVPLCTIILSIIFCTTNQPIRRSIFHLLGLEHCFTHSKNSVEISPEEYVRRAYFHQLQQQWSEATISSPSYKNADLLAMPSQSCKVNNSRDKYLYMD